MSLQKAENEYDEIVRIGQSILSSHQEKEWKQKTRSNFAHYRLESIYFAIEELERVLLSWKNIAEMDIKDKDLGCENKDSREQCRKKLAKARKHYHQIFKHSKVVSDCIAALRDFKSVARYFFVQSLVQVFPQSIPFEVVEHIWYLSQTGDVKYSIPMDYIEKNYDVEKYEVGELLIQLKGIAIRVYLVVHRCLLNSSMSFQTIIEQCMKDIEKLQEKIMLHGNENIPNSIQPSLDIKL